MKKVPLYALGSALLSLMALPVLSEEGSRCNVRSLTSPPISTNHYEVTTRSIQLNFSDQQTEMARFFRLVTAEQEALSKVCAELRTTIEEVANTVNQQTSNERTECDSSFQGMATDSVTARVVDGKGRNGTQHEFEKVQVHGPFLGNSEAIESWRKYIDLVEKQGINHATIQVLAKCTMLGSVTTECWEECPQPRERTIGVEEEGITWTNSKQPYE